MVLIFSTVAVLGLLATLASRSLPLGVPGEWEWTRISTRPLAIDVAVGALGLTIYALAVAWLAPSVKPASGPRVPTWVRLVALVAFGLFVQLAPFWALLWVSA